MSSVIEEDDFDLNEFNPTDLCKGDAEVGLRKISRDLRDQFKAFCARRGRTMTETLVEYMYRCITGEQARIERREEMVELREKRELDDLRKRKSKTKRRRR